MNQYHLYEESFTKFTPDWLAPANLKNALAYLAENRESLLNFFRIYAQQSARLQNMHGIKVLEMGCGLGGLSLALAQMGANVTAVDISHLAISTARELARLQNVEIEFLASDAINLPDNIGKFDVIIDSHLLHCLVDENSRHKYLRKVKTLLNDEGIFLCETMCMTKNLSIPIGYQFKENNEIWKEYQGSEVPYRKVSDSFDIENEIKNAGLQINYLYYHHELSFQIYPEFKNYPHDELPKTLRLAASKGQL